MRLWMFTTFFTSSITTSLAQFVHPPTDLKQTTSNLGLTVRYKQVPPQICKLPPGVSSYSGFVDVDEHTHIFWWFFEASQNKRNAPLTIYVDGGPGYPAEPAVFVDLGLCADKEIDADIENLQYAWNNLTNVLIIDSPNQVGFSYSHPTKGYFNDDGRFVSTDQCPTNARDTCGTYSDFDPAHTANSTANAAPAVWKTVQGFLSVFPAYQSRDLHLASISYGGHYGPVFGQYFETQNERIVSGKIKNGIKLNLKTLFIGNGWYDPQLQYAAFYNYTVSPGNSYDFRPFRKSVADRMYDSMYGKGKCWDQIQACYDKGTDEICAAADVFCAVNVEATFDNHTANCGYKYDPTDDSCEDDISNDAEEPTPSDAFLNRHEFQQALGVFTNWTLNNVVSHGSFGPTGDDARSVLGAVTDLVKRGIYVVMYAGDRDYTCNWLGGEAVAERIDAPGWRASGYANISTSDGLVHGQVKQSGNFAFARIYAAGHVTSYWQPLTVYSLFQRAINGRDLVDGRTNAKTFKSTGPNKSTYHEGQRGLLDPQVNQV